MTSGRYPVKKTGSADNERLQINKALDNILDTLSRADQWDSAFSWGNHADENYAAALSELQQFAEFGIPSKPTLNKTLETTPNGTEVHAITATWSRAGDDSIVYDLEIRESDPSVSIDANSITDILDKSDIYSVPIISNDSQDALITYKAFFDADTRYWFRVRIRKNTLVSNWSEFENIVTTQDENTPPAPTNLTATPIADGVRLNWDYDYDSNPNVAKVEVLRDGVVIDTVPRPALSYIDEPLTVQASYTYTVRAVSFLGVQSALSNSAGAVPNRATVTIRASSEPTVRPDGSPLQDGDRWIDLDNGDRPYVRVGNSWVPEYTDIEGGNVGPGIDGGNITVGTIDADRIDVDGIITAEGIVVESTMQSDFNTNVTDIDGGKITTGTVDADRIDVAGIITANEIVVRNSLENDIDANVTSIDGGIINTGTLNADDVNVININADEIITGTIESANYQSGVAGWKIGIDDNSAEFNNITARGNVIAGAANQERVELTPGGDYRIWVGDGPKTDGNGVFWVKGDGTAFINKNEFDISDGGITTGAFSNGGGTVTGSSNSLTAPSGAIEVGEGGIYFDVNIFFKAFRSRNNISSSSCVIPGVSGALLLQRANNSSFTSGVTTVNNITFSGQGTRFWVDEPFPPGPLCDQRIQFENTKTFVDNPTAGTYYYRLSYSTWQSSLFGNEVSENVLYATFTSSAA